MTANVGHFSIQITQYDKVTREEGKDFQACATLGEMKLDWAEKKTWVIVVCEKSLLKKVTEFACGK